MLPAIRDAVSDTASPSTGLFQPSPATPHAVRRPPTALTGPSRLPTSTLACAHPLALADESGPTCLSPSRHARPFLQLSTSTPHAYRAPHRHATPTQAVPTSRALLTCDPTSCLPQVDTPHLVYSGPHLANSGPDDMPSRPALPEPRRPDCSSSRRAQTCHDLHVRRSDDALTCLPNPAQTGGGGGVNSSVAGALRRRDPGDVLLGVQVVGQPRDLRRPDALGAGLAEQLGKPGAVLLQLGLGAAIGRSFGGDLSAHVHTSMVAWSHHDNRSPLGIMMWHHDSTSSPRGSRETSMAISKRLRAEILRRDNSTCQKCGAKAPSVQLVIDHVIPVALGGSDEPSNLQTLCEPCNSGKSATPPDAATVEQVSSDARRWAAAMQAAAANMVGDLQLRQKNRDYFKQCWLNWHWGSAESPEYAPLPATWEKSVDQILAGGLPVELLKDCIDTAFAYDSVKRENKFKYACGVAWRKIDKLQQAARTSLGDGAPPAAASDYPSWRQSLVGDLIEIFDTGDIEEAEDVGIELDAVRQGVSLDEDDKRDPVVSLMEFVYWDYRTEADFTHDDVMALLLELPAGVGEHALKIARFNLYDDGETPRVGRARFLRQAMRAAGELFRVRESLALLDGLPEVERAAWLAYGDALAGVGGRHGGRRDRTRALEKAAEAARVTKDGSYYLAMCQGTDDVLPFCRRQAHFFVLFEGVKCCTEATPEERHAQHGFCEAHLESLVENGFTAPNGRTFAIRDFWGLEEPTEEESPF